jgi:hypothetical protein
MPSGGASGSLYGRHRTVTARFLAHTKRKRPGSGRVWWLAPLFAPVDLAPNDVPCEHQAARDFGDREVLPHDPSTDLGQQPADEARGRLILLRHD